MFENVKQNFQSAYDFVRQNPVVATIVGLSAVTIGVVTGIDRSVKKVLPKGLKGTKTQTRRRRKTRTRVVYVRPIRRRIYYGRKRRY